MNERIRELAEQATKYAFEWAEGDSKINPKITPDQWLKAYQEKFAELIVKECIEVAKRTGDNFGSADPNVLEGGRGGAFCVYQNIKNTFGVEE